MQVCEQLRQLRTKLNLSQERFGKRIGVSGKSISAYETGRCLPSIKVLRNVSNEFNVDFTEMSSTHRTYLNKRFEELEASFKELRNTMTEILSL